MAIIVIVIGLIIAAVFALVFLTPGIYFKVKPNTTPAWYKVDDTLIAAGSLGILTGFFISVMGFFVQIK